MVNDLSFNSILKVQSLFIASKQNAAIDALT